MSLDTAQNLFIDYKLRSIRKINSLLFEQVCNPNLYNKLLQTQENEQLRNAFLKFISMINESTLDCSNSKVFNCLSFDTSLLNDDFFNLFDDFFKDYLLIVAKEGEGSKIDTLVSNYKNYLVNYRGQKKSFFSRKVNISGNVCEYIKVAKMYSDFIVSPLNKTDFDSLVDILLSLYPDSNQIEISKILLYDKLKHYIGNLTKQFFSVIFEYSNDTTNYFNFNDFKAFLFSILNNYYMEAQQCDLVLDSSSATKYFTKLDLQNFDQMQNTVMEVYDFAKNIGLELEQKSDIQNLFDFLIFLVRNSIYHDSKLNDELLLENENALQELISSQKVDPIGAIKTIGFPSSLDFDGVDLSFKI